MSHFGYDEPFKSRRSPVMGMEGAVATSHPLAAQAGLRMLMAGGNAVDAAIATAAALVVLEPTSNGLGSDAFALVWDGVRLHGLNASGCAPKALNSDLLRRSGHSSMPYDGWMAVTVPGAVSAWVELSRVHGSLPLTETLKPAMEYAERGVPVPPIISGYWKSAERRLGHISEFRRTFLPKGRAPEPGEVFSCPDMASTLRIIAESDGEEFYRGSIAQAIAEYAEATGGYITFEDMRSHKPEWVEPISTGYRGYEVYETPPNGQGLTALMALNILEGYDIGSLPMLSRERLHFIIESLRLAFADAHAYIADPRHAHVPIEGLLSKKYAESRRAIIDSARACLEVRPGSPSRGDTVYLCAADGDGMMVSFIQSNYMGFGSGIVIPNTGISLQNRGAGFSLIPGHPNELAPGKRPYHTIIPSFIMKDGVPLAAYGVMGGDMQPQGHVQVVSAIIDHGLNPQAAIDCPRVRVVGQAVHAEPDIDIESLLAMGHEIEIVTEMAGFGGGQMIWRDPDTGCLIAGSESRKDGQAVAF